MKKVKALFFVGSIALIALLLFYTDSAKKGIIHHNKTIDDLSQYSPKLIATCTSITMSSNGKYKENEKITEIFDKQDIKSILSNLKVDDVNQPTGSFHACSGNIRFKVIQENKEYVIHYDHGTGIYPISGIYGPVGFIELSNSKCINLNSILMKYRFTKSDIGH